MSALEMMLAMSARTASERTASERAVAGRVVSYASTDSRDTDALTVFSASGVLPVTD
jgi:hypothetical protein